MARTSESRSPRLLHLVLTDVEDLTGEQHHVLVLKVGHVDIVELVCVFLFVPLSEQLSPGVLVFFHTRPHRRRPFLLFDDG